MLQKIQEREYQFEYSFVQQYSSEDFSSNIKEIQFKIKNCMKSKIYLIKTFDEWIFKTNRSRTKETCSCP